MTLHDYKLFCPALRQYNLGGLCEECRPFHYSGSISGKCVKNSLASSMLCATEMFLHDLFELYTANLDMFIVPSRFVAARLEERGVPGSSIKIIPAFVDSDFWQPSPGPVSGDFVLYAGRLTPEKGIITMVKAFAALPHIPLKIAGSGMLHGHAKRLADSLGAANIEFLGFRPQDEVLELMRNSRFVLMPSEWNENTPRSLLEAFSCGKPAVATRIGGLPEIAREAETALLATPGDVEDLARTVEALWRDEERAVVMGRNARELAVAEFSADIHFDKLLSVYEEIKRV
jgi:glycosyltransferase involved in cell wall biosynthesis